MAQMKKAARLQEILDTLRGYDYDIFKDHEVAHDKADSLLVETIKLLASQSEREIVEQIAVAYDQVGKW